MEMGTLALPTFASVGADGVVDVAASGAVELHGLFLGLVENAHLRIPNANRKIKQENTMEIILQSIGGCKKVDVQDRARRRNTKRSVETKSDATV